MNKKIEHSYRYQLRHLTRHVWNTALESCEKRTKKPMVANSETAMAVKFHASNLDIPRANIN